MPLLLQSNEQLSVCGDFSFATRFLLRLAGMTTSPVKRKKLAILCPVYQERYAVPSSVLRAK